MENLSLDELIDLIHSVFPLLPDDRFLGILIDLPKNKEEEEEDWRIRRKMATEWADVLRENLKALDLDDVRLFAYPNVGSNNAELPSYAYFKRWRPLPSYASELEESCTKISFEEIFQKVKIIMAPTQYSATAPLKNAARKFNLRAATMPGFSPAMIPTLKIDYSEVNRRVLKIKEKLDRAEAAEVFFLVDDIDEYKMLFDLRFRNAHASTGRFPDRGVAGNLPSGEAYIVPYEGEKEEPSLTQGTLPVQIDNNIVLFYIKENRAIKAEGESPAAEEEQSHLIKEPAYGNMAELGFGVLKDFGILPVGKILQDEKLGFHIAFGRSEHFGGIIGPEDFSSPKEVIHLDRIYISATQPRITVQSIILKNPDGQDRLDPSSAKAVIR
jgi:hypothetical protein